MHSFPHQTFVRKACEEKRSSGYRSRLYLLANS